MGDIRRPAGELDCAGGLSPPSGRLVGVLDVITDQARLGLERRTRPRDGEVASTDLFAQNTPTDLAAATAALPGAVGAVTTDN